MWNHRVEDLIIFEDRDILVCHKPAGLAVQNAKIGMTDMESMLKNYLVSGKAGKIPYLAIVHRLDQPVEGILVFAKTGKAAKELSRQISAGEMKKEYLAVTAEKGQKDEGILEDFLKKDGKTNTSFVVKSGTTGGKKARLQYRIVDKHANDAEKEKYLVYILLDTGRHHQIRVQMAHAGMPLLGDRKYGNCGMEKVSLGLCAVSLTFRHPYTKKEMCFKVQPDGTAFEGFDLHKFDQE